MNGAGDLYASKAERVERMTERVQTDERSAWSWLTVEVALYGLILVLALALRVGSLSARVMSTDEAAGAWQAWQLAHGQTPQGPYSPLLLSAQALLFALFGGGDVLARLLPALMGSALVVWPFWLRSYHGRFGALAASFLLALSPTLVFGAGYADGVAPLSFCTLGVVTLWLAYRRDRRPSYVYAIAVLIAVAAIADPRVIGVAVVLAAAWGIERLAFGRNLLDVGSPHAVDWRRWAVVAGATALPVAMTFASNPGGVGAWADFPHLWAQCLGPVLNGQPWYYPLAALLMYEPLLILFGAIGAVDLVARRNEATVLIWVALGMLVLALVAGGRGPGDVALICAPLALVSGRAIGNLVESWFAEARLKREGLYFAIGLGVAVYIAMEAAFYAFAMHLGMPESGEFLWFWILAMAVGAILTGLVLAWYGSNVTWRVGGALVGVALVAATFSSTIGLNYDHANDPRELHVRVASDEGVRDALRVLDRVSLHQSGNPVSTPITVDAAVGPVWRWYLRDWEQVRFVDRLTADVNTPLVLSSSEGEPPALGERYIGQDFVAQTWWQPGQLSANEQLWWWLYRKSTAQPQPAQRVTVWLRVD
jgi:hypothetical protein